MKKKTEKRNISNMKNKKELFMFMAKLWRVGSWKKIT